MRARNYSDEGFVLARRSYGEADRILVIYSRNHGRQSLMAKGVRRTGSRKRGHIEIFNLIKFEASLGLGIDLMTEAEIIDDYREIRQSLKKVALAYFFAEVIGRTTHENEKNEDLFFLLEIYLQRLKTAIKLRSLRKDFIYDALTILGFWPKGIPLLDPDMKLKEVTEREMSSFRVGKKLVS